MLYSFLDSNNKLTTNGIVGIVFFCLIIIAIIVLTIGFFIYKGHVKKIYDVERRLTKLLNHPIDKKIKRLSNIADTNDDFSDQVNNIKIIYASEIVKRLQALNDNYQVALSSKKIWKINKNNALVINSWIKALDIIDAQINVLSTVTDILIDNELNLRDYLIDFMQEWNTVEEHYENNVDQDNIESSIDDETIDAFNKQKNIYLTQYDKAISKGDFATVKTVYNKLNDLGKKFLKETNLYAKHMDYFTNQFPVEKEELIDANSSVESVRKLKKILDDKERLVKQALEQKDYSTAIDGIDGIFTLLEDFKHNKKLENAFEMFIQSSGNELESFFKDIQQGLELVKQEDSEEYQKASDQLKEQVNVPIENIKKIVSKIEKETSKSKKDVETLNDQRISFEDNLAIINRGIELLKSIKTKDEKLEQEYLNFLSEVLKAKSTLLAINNLLSNPNNGLNDNDKLLDQKLVMNFQEQLDVLDAKDLKEFDDKYQTKIAKTNVVEKLQEMNRRLNGVYASIQEAYRYYSLAVGIKIMYTDIKQPEYGPIWEELMKEFYKGNYKQFVQDYIKESEIQH